MAISTKNKMDLKPVKRMNLAFLWDIEKHMNYWNFEIQGIFIIALAGEQSFESGSIILENLLWVIVNK